MPRVIAELTVVPLGTSSPSMSTYVAEVSKVLNGRPGVGVMLTPMGTILEGEWEEVLAAVRAAHEVPFKMGALRVATRLSIDERRDREMTMAGKIEAVLRKI